MPRDAAAVCAAYLKRGTILVPRDAAAVHGVQLLILSEARSMCHTMLLLCVQPLL